MVNVMKGEREIACPFICPTSATSGAERDRREREAERKPAERRKVDRPDSAERKAKRSGA